MAVEEKTRRIVNNPTAPEYYRDQGCQFSEGRLCQDCPFDRCVEELSASDRIKFGLDWRKERAIAWRKW